MPARTPGRSAMHALVLSCLLLLAGFATTDHGAGSPGVARSNPAVAGDPFAAPSAVAVRAATIQPTSHRTRMAVRAMAVTGHRLAPSGASGPGVSAERVASLADRTLAGHGDHLAVGPAISVLAVFDPRPGDSVWAVASAVSTAQDAVPARAPPAV